MEANNYVELLEETRSPNFDIFRCIHELSQNGNNIGVYYYLVSKLHLYSYLELEFYIPQLIQVLVSFETESMALSDFLLDKSRKFPHFCLITFWNLQAYVFELKNDPNTYSFHIVRYFINELQNVMFNQDISKKISHGHQFRENLSPSLAMCGSIAASFGIPQIDFYVKPIIISQGRQQKSFLFKLANFHKTLTKNLTMKNSKRPTGDSDDEESRPQTRPYYNPNNKRKSESSLPTRLTRYVSHSMILQGKESFEDRSYNSDYTLERKMNINTRIVSKKSNSFKRKYKEEENWDSVPDAVPTSALVENKLSSHSMPDLPSNGRDPSIDEMSITPIVSDSSSNSLVSLEWQEFNKLNINKISSMLVDEQVKSLQVNYFKKETEFVMVLQNISTRLSQVPKEARLTSLRAELSIINSTFLPSEIDIPQLLPISSKQNKKFHKILKLNVNEACVLNSAERVPFLLLIEFLGEETDFDPMTEYNKNILLNQDLNDSPSMSSRKLRPSRLSSPVSNRNSFDKNRLIESSNISTNFEETDLGDMSVIAISNEQSFITHHLNPKQSAEMQKNLNNSSVVSGNPEGETGAKTKGNKKPSGETLGSEVSTKDLSTQMRIAAVMLQQLEKSGQNNSEQSAAIKARIINSMKALQDKFENIDYRLIQEMNDAHLEGQEPDAGDRKLENDFKLSEDWTTKKNRIRKSSAYGHLKNWDLCSVIAKNGDDLPQEAFACQLISLMSNIWKANNVGVWTKNMKILVTSANTGLVETINNALSIHSIKKSLTEISVKSGENPKGRVASLNDYFKKVYGDEKSSKYKKAQTNFAKSLAAYSIICYVLQIKDRHNGNIMLDNQGHIIHIDFGFLLSNSPGSVGFEAAPFKLTFEYVEVLGGLDGKPYCLFRDLCKESFRVLRKNCDHLVNMVDLMQKDSSLPCFRNGSQTSVLLKQRLQLELTDTECDNFVETSLIAKSLGSVYTRLYDQFQLLTQGIYS